MDVVRFDCLIILKDLSYKGNKAKVSHSTVNGVFRLARGKIRTRVDDLHALCLIFAFLLGDFDLDLANLNR